ncbi:hypothetical protein BU23DRAFT_635933 [Bimuria novae-zelandiae CBS 107.79]|uniref:Uncharacterized protein n=1 Tax=Bimuria novae-zelandiae CBS 107.79 TaxID=1447943 RepID=A0A6A5UIW9_9PLEO|nr:hypothetical protein BU23DRAFT_635933 [Bimuria novae-zelandiae CBS 107.79]
MLRYIRDLIKTSIQPSERASERSGQASSREASVGSQLNLEKVKGPRGRPRKPRQQESEAVAGYASIEATGNLVLSPSTSQYSGSRYGEELASMGLRISEPANSNTTASSSRRGKSRNPSPVESLDDMHIFDKPISDALENICANIGIIPRSIQAQFEAEERLRPFMLSIDPVPTSCESIRLESRDFKDICKVQDTTIKY